jgi:SAM-dependent methyltransferase
VTVAPDGSPVELYLRLRSLGEAERIHEVIQPGAEILELGWGVGRITHELVRLGHPVVAVDESAEMLRHVRGAETILSRIEDLALGRKFPCVLLLSHLVNAEENRIRAAFLDACARHVTPTGVVVIERHPPDWSPVAGPPRRVGEVETALEDVQVEPPFVAATVRYEADGRTWRHPFRARLLDDEELDRELVNAGLERTRILDEHGAWVEARLYSAP